MRPILDALLPLLAAVISVAVPILTRALLARFKLQDNAVLAGLVSEAAKRAGGIAYAMMVAEAGHIGDQPIRNVAIAKGVGYVSQMLPETLAKLSLTPDHVGQMVAAELGRLLAADPTIGIPAAPAPALVPAA